MVTGCDSMVAEYAERTERRERKKYYLNEIKNRVWSLIYVHEKHE